MKTCGLLSISLIFITIISYAQDFVAIDTLSYKELGDLEYKYLLIDDFNNLKRLASIHLKKAKKDNNNLEVARAYYSMAIDTKPEIILKYSDSIILATNSISHKSYPTLGYLLKANTHYNLGNFQVALEIYLTAYNLAISKNNFNQQIEAMLGIAAIRNVNDQPDMAIDLYKKIIKLLDKEKETPLEDYLLIYHNLSLAHLRSFRLDSARHYVSQGIALAQNDENHIKTYMDFVSIYAQIEYFKGNYKTSRDSLFKYLSHYEGTNKAIKMYYLGKIAQKNNDEKLATFYFGKIDSVVKKTEDPFDELLDVYQQLAIQSGKHKHLENQINYINKFMHYDSLLRKNKGRVINQAVLAFDIPQLKRDKASALNQLKSRQNWIITLTLIISFSLSIGIYYFMLTKKMSRKIKQLLNDEIIEIPIKRNYSKTSSQVPLEIKASILRHLVKFEESKKFLSKDIDLSKLAELFNTNTTYLSLVINQEKKTSFPTYIKNLKIAYAINSLKNNKELLKYNYQGLAEIFGFKTGYSFSKAFYARTGVYPSKFLKELKNKRFESDL